MDGLPTPGLMQSDAGRVQLLTRTEDPITEAMRSCEEVDVADSATARGGGACAPTTLAAPMS